MQTKQKDPQMKKTLDCKLACSGSTMYGVEYAMAQFNSLREMHVRWTFFWEE